MTKWLFIDIDGVFNSIRSTIGMNGCPAYNDQSTWYLFDPVAVGLLKSITKQTNCKVVLSSSWRKDMTLGDLNTLGNVLGVEIHDVTPHVVLVENRRGVEIEQWFDGQGIDYSEIQYAILDDARDFLDHQIGHLVKVNGSEGLSLSNYYDAINILNS